MRVSDKPLIVSVGNDYRFLVETNDLTPQTKSIKWSTMVSLLGGGGGGGGSDPLVAVLTGLDTALTGNVSSSDTILQAFGRLEHRVNLNDAKLTGNDRVLKAGDL